jgi:hypothetical protein
MIYNCNYINNLFFWISLGLLIGLNMDHIIHNGILYYKILIGYIMINIISLYVLFGCINYSDMDENYLIVDYIDY